MRCRPGGRWTRPLCWRGLSPLLARVRGAGGGTWLRQQQQLSRVGGVMRCSGRCVVRQTMLERPGIQRRSRMIPLLLPSVRHNPRASSPAAHRRHHALQHRWRGPHTGSTTTHTPTAAPTCSRRGRSASHQGRHVGCGDTRLQRRRRTASSSGCGAGGHCTGSCGRTACTTRRRSSPQRCIQVLHTIQAHLVRPRQRHHLHADGHARTAAARDGGSGAKVVPLPCRRCVPATDTRSRDAIIDSLPPTVALTPPRRLARW